jgi:hypothetical protein
MSAQASTVRLMSQEQALAIAEGTLEAKAFLEFRHGKFAECVQRRVEKPCDSNWVTCIDDAWVVKFIVAQRCALEHDGRLDLTFLIDAKSGEVISKYPEIEYFSDPTFCRDDDDCMAVPIFENQCRNFVFAQADEGVVKKEISCFCSQSACAIK